jgi:DNA primase
MNKLDLYRNCAKIVREAVSPEQALSRYVPGLVIRKDFAKCVFHNEDTPSLHIGPSFAHCFGCGFTGDTTAIVMRLFKVNMHDALVKLNEDFQLNMPITDRPTLRQRSQIYERAQLIEKKQEQSASAEELERLERRLDLEQELYLMQDLAEEFRHYDPDEPFHPIFVFATKEIELIQYKLDCEG